MSDRLKGSVNLHYTILSPKSQETFWSKVEKTDSCWIWTGFVGPKGYGHWAQSTPHRIAYELLRGNIPNGLTLDHLCRNRICVNPDHLEPVTLRENLMRGNSPSSLEARQTHCHNGHEFNQNNTYFYKTKKGGTKRLCRICRTTYHRTYQKLYRERKKMELGLV